MLSSRLSCFHAFVVWFALAVVISEAQIPLNPTDTFGADACNDDYCLHRVQYETRLRNVNNTFAEQSDTTDYDLKFETLLTGISYASTFENYILKNR